VLGGVCSYRRVSLKAVLFVCLDSREMEGRRIQYEKKNANKTRQQMTLIAIFDLVRICHLLYQSLVTIDGCTRLGTRALT
jgi:hypothetical protein